MNEVKLIKDYRGRSKGLSYITLADESSLEAALKHTEEEFMERKVRITKAKPLSEKPQKPRNPKAKEPREPREKKEPREPKEKKEPREPKAPKKTTEKKDKDRKKSKEVKKDDAKPDEKKK